MEFIRRFFEPPEGHFFLFGPRGTGKSTFLRHRFPKALFVDLLDPETYRTLQAKPERLREMMEGDPDRRDVVIDEVQKVPQLLSSVHQMIEERKDRRFVLTGSSARTLKRTGVNLLAGRAALRTLHPFMAAELPDFKLEEALSRGTVPLIVDSAQPKDALYLKEEVQYEGLVRRIGSFARFLEAASFAHASTLNVSNLARECHVERKTATGFLEVLQDLLLCFQLPVFSKRAQRQTVAHPKFYFFDAGVFRSLRPQGPLDRPQEIDGGALEGLVAQHLRSWIAYSRKDFKLYYWKTRSGSEVDFILYGEGGFWAVEVKNSRAVRPRDVRPLATFKGDYPECRPVLLYRGRERLQVGGIPCRPCEEFLSQLRPDQPIV
jgi:predicted AAA+ superfamily ATPase